MKKTDFVAKVATLTETTQVATKPYVDAFVDAVIEALCEGETVELVGFGKFECGKRVAHTGRNPKTGESVEIPEKTTVKFIPSQCFKDAVND